MVKFLGVYSRSLLVLSSEIGGVQEGAFAEELGGMPHGFGIFRTPRAILMKDGINLLISNIGFDTHKDFLLSHIDNGLDINRSLLPTRHGLIQFERVGIVVHGSLLVELILARFWTCQENS
jgi:hypothetical protein